MMPTKRKDWLLCTALAPLLLAGSCQPEIRDFSAVPSVVCPGDVVTLRLAAADYEGGQVTAAPPPVASVAPFSVPPSEPLRLTESTHRICASTRFDVILWNADTPACVSGGTACGETDCSLDTRACAATQASVMTGDQVLRADIAPCGGAVGGEGSLEVSAARYSEPIVVREVENCTSRSVTVGRGGTSVTLAPGETSTVFAGETWVGTWEASEILVPPEGCPDPWLISPGREPTAPPTMCLEFTVGCPDSDTCG